MLYPTAAATRRIRCAADNESGIAANGTIHTLYPAAAGAAYRIVIC